MLHSPNMVDRPRSFAPWMAGCLVLAASLAVTTAHAADQPGQPPRRAGEPPAPAVPAELTAAIQESRYDDARRILTRLDQANTDPDRSAYLKYLTAIIERLAGKPQAALPLLTAAIVQKPTGPWAAKIRHELAANQIALGNLSAAEQIVRAEATRLLAPDRKDQLAAVYETMANRLLTPDDPLIAADPKTALALLEQAQTLARGPTLRARYLAAMVRTSLKANQPTVAIQHASAYLEQFPTEADALAVRFDRGLAERQMNHPVEARRIWTDLAADIERTKPTDPASPPSQIRANALYAIASTYHVPGSAYVTNVNLSIAALKRYLAAYPAGSDAVQAAYTIGTAYQAAHQSVEALTAYREFLAQQKFQTPTDESRRLWTELAMPATFQSAEILQGQQKWAQAINAWKSYLTRFPDGPQTADAQQAILETQLLIASDHLTHRRYDQARASWTEFVTQNPLDSHLPDLLFSIGESYQLEKQLDKAIAAWESLISRYPDTPAAAHAQFATALSFENDNGQPTEAIERFRKINVDPWRSMARARIAVMQRNTLNVVTPRTFRSGEKAQLEVSTRNIETLHFSAYKLNAEVYFRKKSGLANVENLAVSLVAPDVSWSMPVPGYARYKPIDSKIDLPKLELPGTYVVKVSDDKTLQATTLVVRSDLDAIVRSSREQGLVYVQDMKTGKGRPRARVLVAQSGEILLDALTGPDGTLLRDWPKPRDASSQLGFLVIDGPHVAGSFLNVPQQLSQGLSPRAYIYTDRPAYRPGNSVSIRGVIREIDAGLFVAQPNASYTIELTDSRGRVFLSQPVRLSQYGTFALNVPLSNAAPAGMYNIRAYQPGKVPFTGSFEVQSYELEPVQLSIDLKQSVYYRGETVHAELFARFNYGTPLAGRPVEVSLPDGRTLKAKTNTAGKLSIEFPTVSFSESEELEITARLPLDNVSTTVRAILAVRGFEIALNTARDTYLVAESFPLEVTTTDALGKPIGQKLTATLIEKLSTPTGTTERDIEQKQLETDPSTGRASIPFQIDSETGGHFLIRVAGTDRFDSPIIADRPLFISGSADSTKLRLLADQLKFKVGEEARIRLHSRDRSGTALITWEANRILSYKLVDLVPGENSLNWKVDNAQFPNFSLTAAHMSANHFDEAKLDLEVSRELQLTIKPTKPVVQPGEEIDLEITTTDQLGNPVSAELSLAMVDQALFRRFEDRLPAIGPFFYNQTRTGAFAAIATSTFQYHAQTSPVSSAVVEEAEREAATVADAKDRDRVLAEAASTENKFANPMLYTQNAPAPAASAELKDKAKKPAEMMGRMGGAMGGMAGEMAGMEHRKSPTATGAVIMGLDELGRAPAPPRQRFVETAYWNPAVVTDKNGKTVLRFKAPSALAEFRLTARGVTGSDTLVGQTTAPITVRKNFSVDLKVPTSLTQGDKPRFLATIQHTGAKGKVTLRLSTYAGGRDEVYPATIEIKDDGVAEFLFDAIEIPDADSFRLTLSAAIGELSDVLTTQIPIHPWGVPAYASASGTSSESTTLFVGLAPGRAYENADMLITIAPTLKRMILDLALGQTVEPLDCTLFGRIFPPPSNTLIDQASDLLAATAALGYLRDLRGAPAPEASRLLERARQLTSALIAAQNEDGGWSWAPPTITRLASPESGAPRRDSDPPTSAAVFQALVTAEPFGVISETKILDQAASHLTRAFASNPQADVETRAALLHALSTRHAASFEAANTMNRMRNRLPDAALAHLALTFANLDRPSIASEILALVKPHAHTESAGPSRPARLFWDNQTSTPHSSLTQSAVETTALVALAIARVEPGANQLEPAIEWLLAHRAGNGWTPHAAVGPALTALAAFYGKAQGDDNRYHLAVRVNDTAVAQLDVIGSTEGQSIIVPRAALQVAKSNRIRFDMTGRGRFGYAVTLCGFTRDFAPDQVRANRDAVLVSRAYLPATPELDGRPLPTGFAVAPGSTQFENRVTQVPHGGKARVQLIVNRIHRVNTPVWQRDFLIVEEHLPAGTSLVQGSLKSTAAASTLSDGTLTLYFPSSVEPGAIQYEVFGFLPGQFRALPASVRSAYEPGRYHLGQPGELRVRTASEPATDPYRFTPDELFARGKAEFQAGRFAPAGAALEPLFSEYSLREDITADASRMLLLINLHDHNARKIVQYFEVVKDRAPDMILSFDQLLLIGQAYRDLGEYERALIVWRGLIEASYLEDGRIAEFLRQRGENLRSATYLLNLWRAYPSTASIESDFFGLSQLLVQTARQAITNPQIRRELAAAGVTRSQLLLEAIRIIETFLTQSPTNPLADAAGLALLDAHTELENFKTIPPLALRFAKIYPKSPYVDSFQYAAALADFHLGQFDRAISVARKIAQATYKDLAGADQPSPNKWQALYILGQIHDARRQPAQAIDYYRQVADRFTDASSAIQSYTRKQLQIPEVTVARPVATAPQSQPAATPTVHLQTLNITSVDLEVYPVDLMRLYLARRSLNDIAGIDLAGITPLIKKTIALGDLPPYEPGTKAIELPLTKTGAYLLMLRGDNIHASGILLVTPLELEVFEEPASGDPNAPLARIRMTVRDAATKALVPDAQVKVKGGNDADFTTGVTDLRGVFVAESPNGTPTAVVRKGLSDYAFYRGKPAAPVAPSPRAMAGGRRGNRAQGLQSPSLDSNLRDQGNTNSLQQIDRLRHRLENSTPNQKGSPAGNFR